MFSSISNPGQISQHFLVGVLCVSSISSSPSPLHLLLILLPKHPAFTQMFFHLSFICSLSSFILILRLQLLLLVIFSFTKTFFFFFFCFSFTITVFLFYLHSPFSHPLSIVIHSFTLNFLILIHSLPSLSASLFIHSCFNSFFSFIITLLSFLQSNSPSLLLSRYSFCFSPSPSRFSFKISFPHFFPSKSSFSLNKPHSATSSLNPVILNILFPQQTLLTVMPQRHQT